MARKLYYFDIKGLGESIRYLLHYGGLEFEDIRTGPGANSEEWPKLKESLAPPFGVLPIYKEGERTLYQSLAIAHYIGKQVGLVPTDPWEEVNAEAVLHTFNDFIAHVRGFIREQDPEVKANLKKTLFDEHIPFYFERFDKLLESNNGYFAKKLSWADIVFVSLTEVCCEYLQIQIRDTYKNVNALIEEVYNLNGIKEYISKRDSK